jgi:hypothetical protein
VWLELQPLETKGHLGGWLILRRHGKVGGETTNKSQQKNDLQTARIQHKIPLTSATVDEDRVAHIVLVHSSNWFATL